jgi:uncharacterized protein
MTDRILHLFLLTAVVCLMASAAISAEVPDKAILLPPGQVHLTGWLGQRVDANIANRLMKVNLDERLRPFEKPSESGGWSGEHIGKWLHAASLSWQYNRDPALRKRLDDAAARLIAAQAPDGYLGTYAPQHRWEGWDVWTHKYNLIGLLAYYDISGDSKALAAARKIGDLLIATFGEGKRDIIRSGEHVGMAATSVLEPVVLLYRATKDPRYLEFARYITRSYDQPNGPKIVRSLTSTKSVIKTANGKAYEMMSNLVGLSELYRATGDAALLQACVNAYDDIVANQMYIAGGTSLGEHFQQPHHLPNTGPVSENCAQVTWLQLCAELLRITGEARYADTLERIVYNHLLASQKPSGESLCYFTPLAGKKPFDAGMNCCTSSGPRGIALAPTLIYATAPKTLFVNFYETSTAELRVDGVKMKVGQFTRYPQHGAVLVSLDTEKPTSLDLCLRIPAWCKSYSIEVNSKKLQPTAAPGTYLRISRQWQSGDLVALNFSMPAELVKGTHTNAGMVAVQRGPLVLAFDAHPGLPPGQVSPVVSADGTVPLLWASAAFENFALAPCLFKGEGIARSASGDGQKKVDLWMTSFAEAGGSGENFAVWFPSPERLKTLAASPFLGGRESWSRPGNIEASIADGDVSTWRVTFNGREQTEAWFAVERDAPAKIDTIVYAHGHVYHDGGWWDASKGKPRVQIRKTAKGPWEDVGTIDGFPDTTATDAKAISDGRQFTVKFPAIEAKGIRIIGAPACGDNPKQAFASCAELEGLLEKK